MVLSEILQKQVGTIHSPGQATEPYPRNPGSATVYDIESITIDLLLSLSLEFHCIVGNFTVAVARGSSWTSMHFSC